MMIIEERGRGTRASCGFSATLGGATQRVWPVEDLWLLTDSILKFWLPDTKVEDVSLQVVLSPHNLQNIWSTSTSYLSHGKSFSQVHTNFRFDEEFSRIIACPFESGRFSCLIWTCSDDSAAFEDRNADLISITIDWSWLDGIPQKEAIEEDWKRELFRRSSARETRQRHLAIKLCHLTSRICDKELRMAREIYVRLF